MRRLLLPFAAVLLLAACDSSSPSLAPETLPAFCEALNEARLEQSARCDFGWAAVEACDGPGWSRTFERLAEGRIRYDRAEASACLHTTATQCRRYELTSCARVLRGAVEPGGACSVEEDCTGDGRCTFGDACPGTCVQLPRIGEPCSDMCEQGAYCTAGRCVRYRGVGEACDPEQTWPIPSYVDRPPERVCARDLYCDEGRCVADDWEGEFEPLPIARKGARCYDGETYTHIAACPSGTYCDWTETDTCVPQGEAGARCLDYTGEGDRCREGLVCHHAVCSAPAVPGDACTAEGQPCAGGDTLCFQGRCSPYPSLGEGCTPGGPRCLSQTYDPLAFPPTRIESSCDPATLTCMPLASHGAPCDSERDCNAGWCQDGRCWSRMCVD
jgi:hypothetical protein